MDNSPVSPTPQTHPDQKKLDYEPHELLSEHVSSGSGDSPQLPHKRAVSWKLITASALAGLLIVSTAALAWILYNQKSDLQTTIDAQRVQISRQQTEINMQNGLIESQAASADVPQLGVFLKQYDNMLSSTPDGITNFDTQKSQIESTLKTYYRTTSLPSGWAVLSIYEIVKPETRPTGDINALVYWPASSQKPANFVEMIKPRDGAWRVNESL